MVPSKYHHGKTRTAGIYDHSLKWRSGLQRSYFFALFSRKILEKNDFSIKVTLYKSCKVLRRKSWIFYYSSLLFSFGLLVAAVSYHAFRKRPDF